MITFIYYPVLSTNIPTANMSPEREMILRERSIPARRTRYMMAKVKMIDMGMLRPMINVVRIFPMKTNNISIANFIHTGHTFINNINNNLSFFRTPSWLARQSAWVLHLAVR